MRSFRDSNNVEWTVFEVRRQASQAEAISPIAPMAGWLCFESDTSKRRLLKYPERWREFADTELTRLLDEAKPAPRVSLSLSENTLEGGSSAHGN